MPDRTPEPPYKKGDIPEGGTWGVFKKRTTTRALRMDGPFEVETTEGVMRCDDGWLAIDSRGYPYPIAADEFDAIYEEDDDA